MTNRTRIDLALLLPDAAGEGDRCFERLVELLQNKTGITDAHIITRSEEQPGQVCIHVDPDLVSVHDVRHLALQAGARLTQEYGHLMADVEPMPPRRARRLTSELLSIPGVLEAAVAPTGAVRIEFDREATTEAAVRKPLAEVLGQEGAQPTKHDHEEAQGVGGDGHSHGAFGNRAELTFAALCGAVLFGAWLVPNLVVVPESLVLGALITAYFFGAFFPLREAYASVRQGRFEIDFLMLVAAAGAASLGSWAEGALLLFLYSLGHSLESYAMGRAKRAIEALGDLAPRTAQVRRGEAIETVSVEELRAGETVIVKPNERLPADGFVVVGESSVNQAPITGESVPVDKSPVSDVTQAQSRPDAVEKSSRVFAGTINGSGLLEIQVTRAAGDSTLDRVVRMVSEAETNKSPTQQFTDKFERIFVPVVLVGAILAMFVWVVVDEPFSASFYRAMALLVAASPCALAIATPSAVLSGVARAAKFGVLIKGGAPLENLGRLEAIAFDKTGTLTEGKPRLIDLVTSDGVSEEELLRVSIPVEALSDHPLASAVVRDGAERLEGRQPAVATNLRSITGRGVQAEVDGEQVFIGKKNLFDEIDGPVLPEALKARVAELEAAGRTTMIVRHGSRYLGALGLMDTPRKDAAAVIAALRKVGIRRMVMISGDNQQVADAVAKDVGLDEALGDLMPDDKVEAIKRLQSEADVAMVGDGVNDAPAMASATVGIAMGAAGSDVALETADVALMGDDLARLPFAVSLSRAASRVTRQNLWVSLGVVALLVPATILGLGIGPAVTVHEGSTLVVVANALRLLAFKDRPTSDPEAPEPT